MKQYLVVSDQEVVSVMRPVPGFPGYQISEDGHIWSERFDRWLKAAPGNRGYPVVNLRRDGKACKRTVHSLVAEAFIGPRPEGMDVCHGDGDKLNSSVSNLRYGTRLENTQDAIRHGTHLGARTHCPAGHPYSDENTGRKLCRGTWQRYCRECMRRRGRAASARKAEAAGRTFRPYGPRRRLVA